MTTSLRSAGVAGSVRDAASELSAVTVYTVGNGCIQCMLTENVLTGLGIPFVERDITRDENRAARDYLIGDLGYSRAPVVVVDEHDHWSGFQPDQLKRLASRRGSDR